MVDKLSDPAISGVTTYLGPPLMVGHVCSVQYSHTVPYNRFILLKKSTTKKANRKLDNCIFMCYLDSIKIHIIY